MKIRIIQHYLTDCCKKRVCAVFIALLQITIFPLSTSAQEITPPPVTGRIQSSSGFGVNAIASHKPQEKDLSDVGGEEDIDKFEIYFDWDWLRMGYNMTNAELNFSVYNHNWKTRLKKNTAYAAYRMSTATTQSKWDLYLLAGLAYTEATLTITDVSSSNSTDLGFLTGGGIFYQMGRMSLGMGMLVISSQGNFDGLKIATGSTQILTGVRYAF